MYLHSLCMASLPEEKRYPGTCVIWKVGSTYTGFIVLLHRRSEWLSELTLAFVKWNYETSSIDFAFSSLIKARGRQDWPACTTLTTMTWVDNIQHESNMNISNPLLVYIFSPLWCSSYQSWLPTSNSEREDLLRGSSLPAWCAKIFEPFFDLLKAATAANLPCLTALWVSVWASILAAAFSIINQTGFGLLQGSWEWMHSPTLKLSASRFYSSKHFECLYGKPANLNHP